MGLADSAGAGRPLVARLAADAPRLSVFKATERDPVSPIGLSGFDRLAYRSLLPTPLFATAKRNDLAQWPATF